MNQQYTCLHDKMIEELFIQYDKCIDKKNKIVSFFLSSLSTGNMLWRRFLPAFAITRTFPRHHFVSSNEVNRFRDDPCKICNIDSWAGFENEDYNFYLEIASNAGGIPAFSLEFCIVLLTEFNKLANNAIEPSCTDAHIFNEIMMSLVDASSQETLKKDIVKRINKIQLFDTNKTQTQCLLQTLGFCGILETAQHKSPFHEYVNLGLAPKKSHNSDWEYPVDFWTPSDGINREAFKFWFGNYIQFDKFWE